MAAKRLLIAAGQAAPGPEALPFGIRELIDGADEILVISPTLPGRLDWLTSATDRAQERADDRLQVVLQHLHKLDAPVQGRVGADDPLLAFEDALRDFDADHILVALRAADRAGWQERGLLDQLGQRFDLPVTIFQLS